MDNLTREQRTRNMRAIRSKDTTIELMLRKALFARGVRYRVHRKCCGVSCDISIAKYKVAVFCDGDYWHGKSYAEHPASTNKRYWDEKIKRNVERDLEQTIRLRDNGWTVLRFWESEIKADVNACVNIVINAIEKRKRQ